jgi:hypothetical protein
MILLANSKQAENWFEKKRFWVILTSTRSNSCDFEAVKQFASSILSCGRVSGRGCALSQAVIFIPYYWHTNPVGVRNARRMIAELL